VLCGIEFTPEVNARWTFSAEGWGLFGQSNPGRELIHACCESAYGQFMRNV